ncbi:unnamed protein product [Mytilus coruscus]|uniref:Caspase recruitment domain-containing protein n=1 Tax=Mytilus coruscus TaxID=42192 RepID=A0A6J8CCX4_MYTCO|nr:unnamed protein product [Mytilus coruscus]
MSESQIDRVCLLKSEFLKFLKPTDVIFNIQGLEEDFIDEICELEKINRKEASNKLLKKISERSELLPKFILALSDKGYQRFVDPISNIYPDRGRMFCQEYFEFIINYLTGELVDVLEPLQLCAYLYKNRCIEQSDKEAIEAMQSSKGRTAACREMFLAVKRRKDNWALLLLEAIKETQEYVKLKMDPSASQEELERTGILLASTKQRYYSDSTFSEKESVPFKSSFQLDVKLRQKFQLQSTPDLVFSDCIITNDQLVLTGYSSERLHIYNMYGSYNRELKLFNRPQCIAVINDDDVVVSYDQKFVEIINISTEQVKNKIVTRGYSCNISYQNGLMYVVIDYHTIDVMNLTGEIIRSFHCPLKSSLQCLSPDTYSLFLTYPFDYALYCCDLNGSNRWNCTFDSKIKPRHVTTDKNGNVYIVCYESNNVIVVSPDGTHYKELITDKEGLQIPTIIYYDKSNDCLLVYNCGTCDAFLFDVTCSTKGE